MKVNKFETKEEWLAGRKGKITGSKLKDIVVKNPYTKDDISKLLDGNGIEYDKKLTKDKLTALLSIDQIKYLESQGEQKIGFYEIIAERIAISPDEENPMDRGTRLEEEAVEKFMEKTGLEVDTSLVIWEREDNAGIAVSPDGVVGKMGAIEVKCLSSARHIEAKLTGQYPKDYHEQILQYFIVNDELEVLHFVMYDPRMPEKLQLITFEIFRFDIEDEIKQMHEYQIKKLEQIEKIVLELTF